MPKLKPAIMILFLMLMQGCSDPCESVAELACKAAGSSSNECIQMKNFAYEADDRDQKVCKHLLETTRQLKPR